MEFHSDNQKVLATGVSRTGDNEQWDLIWPGMTDGLILEKGSVRDRERSIVTLRLKSFFFFMPVSEQKAHFRKNAHDESWVFDTTE